MHTSTLRTALATAVGIEISPITLIFENDLDGVNVNQQTSRSKVI